MKKGKDLYLSCNTTERSFPMSILHQLKQNFNTILKNSIETFNKYVCSLISRMLEEYDLELAATRRKSLLIIKKVQRSILTSCGLITFKRRYYYDEENERYLYLLDSILKIPKYSRLSEELKLRIINSLDHLSYSDAGKDNLPNGFEISAVTVFNILNKASIEVEHKPFKNTSKKIHVQIDEKYISMKSKRHKTSNRRIYTATIFTDIDKTNPKRHCLINRLIISSRSLPKFFSRINNTLKSMYSVSYDDSIYISGDLASYIQNSPDKIIVCNSKYVADKFHVQKLARKIIGTKLEFPVLSRFNDFISAYLEEISLFPNKKDVDYITYLIYYQIMLIQ